MHINFQFLLLLLCTTLKRHTFVASRTLALSVQQACAVYVLMW
nr:MAG TPA: hypothetical protein [Caudoviricetes sp.]